MRAVTVMAGGIAALLLGAAWVNGTETASAQEPGFTLVDDIVVVTGGDSFINVDLSGIGLDDHVSIAIGDGGAFAHLPDILAP